MLQEQSFPATPAYPNPSNDTWYCRNHSQLLRHDKKNHRKDPLNSYEAKNASGKLLVHSWRTMSRAQRREKNDGLNVTKFVRYKQCNTGGS